MQNPAANIQKYTKDCDKRCTSNIAILSEDVTVLIYPLSAQRSVYAPPILESISDQMTVGGKIGFFSPCVNPFLLSLSIVNCRMPFLV